MAKRRNVRNVNEQGLDPLDFKVRLEFKNKKQQEFYKLIKKKEITICSGSAGSGKSYVSLATALDLLTNKHNPYEQILIIVPTVEAGSMSLGYLKGSKDDKIAPYLDADLYTIEKILKNSGFEEPKKKLKELIQEGYIYGDCMSFARGKNFDNTIIMLNECENFSKDDLYLLLTRIGEDSKIIMSGDIKQLDRKDIKRRGDLSGLEHVSKILKDMDEVGICQFGKEDIVRNPIISKIMDAYESYEHENDYNMFYVENKKKVEE